MIEKLLLEVSAINKKYALINQKTGAYFNIFDITGISSDEVIICKLLYELLNPNGSHYQGDAFLRLFVHEVLQIDFTEQDYKSARVFREFVIGGKRRIDLMIETARHKIPVEVKIYAGDQDRQCFDYYKRAQNSNVYYLTLNGNPPSKESADGLTPIHGEQGVIIGYEEVTPLSFERDIIGWIEQSLTLPEIIKIAPIREILLQFKDVITNLTGQVEGEENMEIVNMILSSPETIKSAIDIEKALPEVKSTIMRLLLGELKRLFENKGMEAIDYDENSINEYYTSYKQLYPGFNIELTKLSRDISAVLYVEVYWNLCFGFAFLGKESDSQALTFVETETVKAKHPRLHNAFVTAVTDVMGEGNKSENAVYWDFLLDDKGEKYDFKHFSPSCADLALNYAEQAKKIFQRLNGYVRAISKNYK